MLRAKQYGPVIEAALKAAKAPPALKGYLIGKMVEAEEMFDLVMGEGLITTQVARTTDLPPDLPPPAPIQSVSASSVDLSERFDTPANQSLSIDELHDHYAKALPLTLAVKPPGFADSLILNRTIRKQDWAPWGCIIKICYTAPGNDVDTASAAMQITGSGPFPSTSSVLGELTKMANGMYRSEPLAPVAPRLPPRVGSLSELLPGSPAAETDAEASGVDMKAWRDGNQTSAADIAYSSGRFGSIP